MKVRLVGLGAVVLALMAGTSCSSGDDSHESAAPGVRAVGPCRIAFRVRIADYADAPSDIYVVNPDGTGQRNLTRRSSVFEWSPVWSPDGREIAFTAQGSELSATQVFVMNADGSGRRQLTRPSADRAYSEMGTWSPDGRTIFYTRLDQSGNVSAWAMNADGSGKRRFQGFGGSAVLSPDGEHIVGTRSSGVESDFYGSPDVYVARSNGEDGRWLTRSGDTEIFGWSPDGEWILYKRMPGVWTPGLPGLYVVRPDGSERKRLTRGDHYDATWSPRGRLILYTSTAGIYVVSLDGRSRRLTGGPNYSSPSWSAGGRRIVFQKDFGQIWVMNQDGTDLRPVAQPVGGAVYDSPAWSPSCR